MEFRLTFMDPKPNEIRTVYIPGKPRQVRGNCKLGKFFFDREQSGDPTKGIDSIEIEPIHGFFMGKCKMFKTKIPEPQSLIFFIYKNQICSMIVKGESLDNLITYMTNLLAEGTAEGRFKVVCKMSPRQSQEWGAYAAMEYEKGESISEKKALENGDFPKATLYDNRMIEEYINANIKSKKDWEKKEMPLLTNIAYNRWNYPANPETGEDLSKFDEKKALEDVK